MIEAELLEKCIKQGGAARELAEAFLKMTAKPQWDAYVTLKTVIDDWNKQIQDKGIDIFGLKDDKSFDRGIKYLSEIGDYAESLEKMVNKLTAEEVKTAEEKSLQNGLNITEVARMKAQKDTLNG